LKLKIEQMISSFFVNRQIIIFSSAILFSIIAFNILVSRNSTTQYENLNIDIHSNTNDTIYQNNFIKK